MSDHPLSIPNDVLSSIARIMVDMRQIASSCRSNPEVTEAIPSCDVMIFPVPDYDTAKFSHECGAEPIISETYFESYVEVKTRSGRRLTWQLQIKSTEECWLVSRSVLDNRSEGQDILIELPDQ